MTKKTWLALFPVLALFLLPAGLSAAGDVLGVPDGAKSAGLGSVSVLMTGTIDAFAGNPAELASVTNLQISMMYARWIAEYDCGYAAAAWPVRGVGTLGLSLKYFGTSFPEFAINGVLMKEALSARSLAATAGVGRSFGRFRTGASVKYVHDQYQDYNFESVAADLGGGLDLTLPGGNSTLSAGLAVRNAGFNFLKKRGVRAVSLPLTAAAGVALKRDPVQGHGLTVGAELDAVLLSGAGLKIAVAAEYGYRSTFFVRGGYSKWLAGEGSFTVGAGFRQSLDKIDNYMARVLKGLDIEVNYALLPFDRQFGQYAHCFSVSFMKR